MYPSTERREAYLKLATKDTISMILQLIGVNVNLHLKIQIIFYSSVPYSEQRDYNCSSMLQLVGTYHLLDELYKPNISLQP